MASSTQAMARGQEHAGIDTTTAPWPKEALTFPTPGEIYCTRIRILRSRSPMASSTQTMARGQDHDDRGMEERGADLSDARRKLLYTHTNFQEEHKGNPQGNLAVKTMTELTQRAQHRGFKASTPETPRENTHALPRVKLLRTPRHLPLQHVVMCRFWAS